MGGFADALRRTPKTITGWERSGLIPKAPFRTTSTSPLLERRLWPVDLVTALQKIATKEGFGRRRPSEFWRLQALLHEAWKAAMASVSSDVRVNHESADRC